MQYRGHTFTKCDSWIFEVHVLLGILYFIWQPYFG